MPEGATSLHDLAPGDRATVAALDALFWDEMQGRVSGELVAAVRPVGGGIKLEALRRIVADHDVRGDEVMYVGDSITDAPALREVAAWGGVALSFNGNGYALAAAEFAAAALDTDVVAHLAEAFAEGGREAVLLAVISWPRPQPGEQPADPAPARVGLMADEPQVLAQASAAMRRGVRGERIARLG